MINTNVHSQIVEHINDVAVHLSSFLLENSHKVDPEFNGITDLRNGISLYTLFFGTLPQYV